MASQGSWLGSWSKIRHPSTRRLPARPRVCHGEKDEGSTHGSPYRYDSHVPLAFWGAGVKPGVHQGWADISDVAPSLAARLDIGAPAEGGRAGKGGGVEVVNGVAGA